MVSKIALVVLTFGELPVHGVDDDVDCWKELQKNLKSLSASSSWLNFYYRIQFLGLNQV